ncbi:uncharacterized oxidoreductase YccK-like isoform X2 [Lineus longissimus]|uniref:uncharacterized oxidoreductase YccK-like isoform X2 n=1 Tax=Lineus longissimus TaxID=88925 RepID=UPI00315D1144
MDAKIALELAEVSKEIVDKAFQCGINFFDTAEAYLNSENVLGRIMAGRRKDAVIATKFGYRGGKKTYYTARDVEESLSNSLRNLQTDYIDLYQVHWPNIIPASELEGVVAELKRQQAKGTIRGYSVCNFGVKSLQAMLDAGGKPLTNQVGYNLLWRGVEYEIIPKCAENNISILPYSPLQQGLLSGRFKTADDVPEGRRRTKHFKGTSTSLSRHGGDGAEKETFQAIERLREICRDTGIEDMTTMALSWLCQQDRVSSVITGARTPQQVEANSKIVKLSQDIVKQLDAGTDELKAIFGGDADLWAPPTNQRIV